MKINELKELLKQFKDCFVVQGMDWSLCAISISLNCLYEVYTIYPERRSTVDLIFAITEGDFRDPDDLIAVTRVFNFDKDEYQFMEIIRVLKQDNKITFLTKEI